MNLATKYNKKEWDKLDFKINSALWKHVGNESSIPIRKKNLIDLSDILNSNKIPFWIQGKTLLGLYKHKNLIAEDNDDDIGVDIYHREKIINEIYPQLEKEGFEIIRQNQDMISIIRDDRYIDICLFTRKNDKISYGEKTFPEKYFKSFESISYSDHKFKIPQKTNELLKIMYPDKKTNQIIKKVFTPSKYIALYKRLKKRKFKIITLEEFLQTEIESTNSLNWKLRKNHLDIITNNGKYKKINDVVNYLSQEKIFDNLIGSTKEVCTTKPFKDPIHLNRKFWDSGNNFFIYNIKYQFRKNVNAYSDTNDYIKANKSPMLFSKEYYESLDELSDNEIKEFLKKTPIEITNGAITGGRHRVCAMIGRLIHKKGYIPFLAKIK